MQQVFVKFNNAEQVRSFVNMIGTLDANFDMGSGRRMVDAKSLLGIFALDLTQPQKLSCNSLICTEATSFLPTVSISIHCIKTRFRISGSSPISARASNITLSFSAFSTQPSYAFRACLRIYSSASRKISAAPHIRSTAPAQTCSLAKGRIWLRIRFLV